VHVISWLSGVSFGPSRCGLDSGQWLRLWRIRVALPPHPSARTRWPEFLWVFSSSQFLEGRNHTSEGATNEEKEGLGQSTYILSWTIDGVKSPQKELFRIENCLKKDFEKIQIVAVTTLNSTNFSSLKSTYSGKHLTFEDTNRCFNITKFIYSKR
jgi:hypothetical protein